MKTRHKLTALAITALLSGSALAFIYDVLREDIDKLVFPSYATIIPTDSPLRNSVQQGACNGDFSPKPCVGSIPEPGTFVLFGLGLIALIRRRI